MPHIYSIIEQFKNVFSNKQSYVNFQIIIEGVILNRSWQSMQNIKRGYLGAKEKTYSSLIKFFNRAEWSIWDFYKIICRLAFSFIPVNQTIVLSGDDTLTKRSGKKVFGKGVYRDPLRSIKTHTVKCLGLKWVVIAATIKLTNSCRPWALPIMTLLCKPKVKGKKHRTHTRMMMIGLRTIASWFPDRKFIMVTDGGYNSHEICRFIKRSKNLTLISRYFKNASLYDKPGKYSGKGRPRKKGLKILSPEEVANHKNSDFREFDCTTLSWYGGDSKKVLYLSGTGLWHSSGKLPLKVKWVWFKDPSGKLKDQCFFSTDPNISAVTILQLYVARWAIEVSFFEMKRYLNLESTMNWTEKSVKRFVPFLMLVYTIICLDFLQKTLEKRQCDFGALENPTFSKVLAGTRQELLKKYTFYEPHVLLGFVKIPIGIAERLLSLISRAA